MESGKRYARIRLFFLQIFLVFFQGEINCWGGRDRKISAPVSALLGLYSKPVPIVPALVKSWSGQVNLGPDSSIGLVQRNFKKRIDLGLNSLIQILNIEF